MTDPAFDSATGHRHFSTSCFNKTWEYIEMPDRKPDDDEQMLLCALASLWHWTQRPDCGDMQRSIGHWQVSRVYCLLGKFEDALHHADCCMHYSATLPPFYKAYAHEAFARTYAEARARMAGPEQNPGAVLDHLAQARTLVRGITDDAERHMVEADLATIKGGEY